MNTTFKTILLCIVILSFNTLKAQKLINESKVIEEEFSVSKDAFLDIENRLGDIRINTWDKNIVKIKSVISVKAWEKDDIKLMMNYLNVDINFEKNPDEIKICSSISKKITNMENVNNVRRIKFANGEKAYIKDYSIKYYLIIPKSLKLSIDQRYGNISITDFKGLVRIELRNGTLNAHNLENQTNIDISYGNANINNVGQMNLIAKSSVIDIEKTENLKITSYYSKINIAKTADLNAVSVSDNIAINDIKSLKGTFNYSSIKINNVENDANLDIKSTKISIDKIRNIDLTSFYSTIRIEEANQIDVSSNNDDFRINNLNAFSGTSSNSKCSIKFLKEKLRIISKNDAYTIKKIPSSFKKISIDGSYGTYNFVFDQNTNYSLNANMRFSSLHFPSEQFNISKSDIKYGQQSISAITKSGKGAASVGFICNSCKISIEHD